MPNCEDAFAETLKQLRKFFFNKTFHIRQIREKFRKESEWSLQELANQDGFPSDLDYLKRCFDRYLRVQDDYIMAYPSALYDTEHLQDIYNMEVKDKNALLSNPTRDMYTPSERPPILRRNAQSQQRKMPFQPHGYEPEITRIDTSALRPVPPSAFNRQQRTHSRGREPPRSYTHDPPPGFNQPRAQPSAPPSTSTSSRKRTVFNEAEHIFLNPVHDSENVQIPEPLADSDESVQARRVFTLVTPLPSNRNRASQNSNLKATFKKDFYAQAQAIEGANPKDFLLLNQEILPPMPPQQFYKKLVVALRSLANFGDYNGSLAVAFSKLPFQTLCREPGRSYADIIKVLKAIPTIFEIYESETFNIPVYNILIKPSTSVTDYIIHSQIMPDIPQVAFHPDDSGIIDGIVIETKGAPFPYALRFVENNLEYKQIARALGQFTPTSHVYQTHSFMSVIVEHNQNYYRGRCITIDGEKNRIELIDYGGVIRVENEKVFVMPESFFNMRYCAVPAVFVGGNLSLSSSSDKPIVHNCSPDVVKLRIVNKFTDYVTFKVV